MANMALNYIGTCVSIVGKVALYAQCLIFSPTQVSLVHTDY